MVLGILLGPAVLGQLAPGAYERIFIGGGVELARYQAEKEQLTRELEGLDAASPIAAREHFQARLDQLVPLRLHFEAAQAAHATRLTGWMTALVVVVLVVMAAEALWAPPAPTAEAPVVIPRRAGRLVTVRYGLLAVWLALAIAHPALLARLPVLLTLLIIAVALLAAFVPLGSKQGSGIGDQGPVT